MGNTGSGKTERLKQLIRQFIGKGIPFCLIDPHPDLAESVLSYLINIGYFAKFTDKQTGKFPERVLKKLVYVDFGIKDSKNRTSHFIPYNILKQLLQLVILLKTWWK
jgi:DNA helicase HerA-like ATPase